MSLNQLFKSEARGSSRQSSEVSKFRSTLIQQFMSEGFTVNTEDTKYKNSFKLSLEKDGHTRNFRVTGFLNLETYEMKAAVEIINPWYRSNVSNHFYGVNNSSSDDSRIEFKKMTEFMVIALAHSRGRSIECSAPPLGGP